MKAKIKGKIENIKKEGGVYVLKVKSSKSEEDFEVILEKDVKKVKVDLEKGKKVIIFGNLDKEKKVFIGEFIGGETVIYAQYSKFEVVDNGKNIHLIGFKNKKPFRILIVKDKKLIDELLKEINERKFINVFYTFQKNTNFPKIVFFSFDEVVDVH